MAQGSADRRSGTGPFSLRFRFPAHPVDEAIGSGAARIVRGGRMMEDFSGKVVIVTGGGRGVGRGIARAFAAAGAEVMLGARTISYAEDVKAEIEKAGGIAECFAADLAREDQKQDSEGKRVV